MRKTFLLLAFILIIMTAITGCGGGDAATVIDLTAAQTNIEALTTEDGNGIYGSLTQLSDEELKLAYGLDTALMSESSIRFSEDLTKASMFAIILPNEGETETIQTQIDAFIENYEYKWTLYMPEEAALVQNAMVTTEGDYLIVIISSDNDAVLGAIQSAIQ